MIVGIDGFEASIKERVGVGRLAVEIIKKLEESDKKNKYRIYLPGPPQPGLPKERDNWEYRILPFHRLWSQISLPLFLFLEKEKPDVFLSPTHYAPRFSPCPRVIFILDLSFLYFPEMFKKTDLYKLKNWTRYSVLKAKRVIAISKSTRDDIIKFYKVKTEKIEVIHPGILKLKTQMSKLKATTKILNLKRKYGIDGDYVLYVGTLQPRKNLARLVEAFRMVMEQSASSADKWNKGTMKLVIVGKKGWMYEEIFAKVKDLRLEEEVIFTGYVPEEDLPYFYKGAKCFVLVSLHEGFGFPVLEAMSHGVPVVCSNVSSLPEIVGEAAVLVDPYDIRSIADGILKVINYHTEDVGKYQELVEKGLRQAKKFSWEKAAKETLKVLEAAAFLGNKSLRK